MKSVELMLKHLCHPRVLQLLMGIFVLLILWNIVSSVRLFSTLDKEVQLKIEASTRADKHTKGAMAFQSTTNQSLFGDYVPRNIDAAGVRESLSNFKVVGVIFSEHEEDSKVLLQKQDGQEQFFSIGDTLSDGSIIKRITSEGVLLLRAGELERLSLPKEELRFQQNDKPLPLGDER